MTEISVGMDANRFPARRMRATAERALLRAVSATKPAEPIAAQE